MGTSNRPPVLRGAELAWLLEELCRIGIRMRSHGWCLGELRAGELYWGEAGLQRSEKPLLSANGRRKRHLRRGHDAGCFTIGVPRRTVKSLLGEWGGTEAALLLIDSVDEVIEELAVAGDWSAHDACELLSYAIRRRITPVRTVAEPG